MKLEILSRSKKSLIPGGLEIDPEATVLELKKAFYGRKKTFYVSRQRFTLPPEKGEKRGVPLEDDRTLASYGLTNGSEIHFKDLGQQIGYGTVFFWEYLGPLMVYPIFYHFPEVYWWNRSNTQYWTWFGSHPSALIVQSKVQTLALAFWSFHYIKRILETFFVHKFSHGTMPIRNLFKNCAYYWGFAAYVSYFINHPLYTPPPLMRTQLLLAMAILCELGNLRCHIIQSGLRGKGEKGYKIPKGFLFEYITCANYTMEVAAWTLFALGTQTLAAVLFALAGGLQMAQWAAGKHRRLVKMFDGRDGREKYPRRWRMIPFIF